MDETITRRRDAGHVQVLPLHPAQLAELDPLERAYLYAELALDLPQREAAEQAVAMVSAGTYGAPREVLA